MIDPVLAAIGFFILGAIAGRSDRLAALAERRRAKTLKTHRLYLAWSNPQKTARKS